MKLTKGMTIVVGKLGSTIYTVQIENRPITVKGHGYLCSFMEGNYALVRPSDDSFVTPATFFRTIEEVQEFLTSINKEDCSID